MPPSDCSKRPMRVLWAPVNAPRSCPKSSDSIRSCGMAAMFSATKGLAARGLWRWSARAMSSLPVPDSPLMSTVMRERDSRPIALNTACIAGASPISSAASSPAGDVGAARTAPPRLALAPSPRRADGPSPCPDGAPSRDSRRVAQARRTCSMTSSTSKGLGTYSNAPPSNAATVLSRSENAVMISTGVSGWLDFSWRRKESPSEPGMRMSLTIASGGIALSRTSSSASSADSKALTCMPAWRSVFSSTQRIELSSSMTQTCSSLMVRSPWSRGSSRLSEARPGSPSPEGRSGNRPAARAGRAP